jgi:hypothetical protein
MRTCNTVVKFTTAKSPNCSRHKRGSWKKNENVSREPVRNPINLIRHVKAYKFILRRWNRFYALLRMRAIKKRKRKNIFHQYRSFEPSLDSCVNRWTIPLVMKKHRVLSNLPLPKEMRESGINGNIMGGQNFCVSSIVSHLLWLTLAHVKYRYKWEQHCSKW